MIKNQINMDAATVKGLDHPKLENYDQENKMADMGTCQYL